MGVFTARSLEPYNECMEFPIETWRSLVDTFHDTMIATAHLADARRDLSGKRDDGEWTLRDMVAHLIDSFSNNHQRFVRLQLESSLSFPGYDADSWRAVQKVDSLDYRLLCDMWKACNGYLLSVIAGIEDKTLTNVWQSPEGPKTLGFLVEDYFSHIAWHLDFFECRVRELLSAEQR